MDRHTNISVELEDGILLEGPARQVFCVRRSSGGAVALFGLYSAHRQYLPILLNMYVSSIEMKLFGDVD
jgi:hypothetical protein